jgi:hypothetical protein
MKPGLYAIAAMGFKASLAPIDTPESVRYISARPGGGRDVKIEEAA